MLNGWLNVIKPPGCSSFDVVRTVKRALKKIGAPKIKIGHTGTLDPLASGVLPIALGYATRLSDEVHRFLKVYEFKIRWGVETNTGDAEGEVTRRSEHVPLQENVERILKNFEGNILQTPPPFSAIKIQGQRAYELARRGQDVILKPRKIHIEQLEFLGRSYVGERCDPASYDHDLCVFRSPGETVAYDHFRVACSQGTYIRSLATDIAEQLGSVGHVYQLVRTQIGPFEYQHGVSLALLSKCETCDTMLNWLWDAHKVFQEWPWIVVPPDVAERIANGQVVDFGENQIRGGCSQGGVCWPKQVVSFVTMPVVMCFCFDKTDRQELVAIGRSEGQTFYPKKVFARIKGNQDMIEV